MFFPYLNRKPLSSEDGSKSRDAVPTKGSTGGAPKQGTGGAPKHGTGGAPKQGNGGASKQGTGGDPKTKGITMSSSDGEFPVCHPSTLGCHGSIWSGRMLVTDAEV